jgi:hypothetical protein
MDAFMYNKELYASYISTEKTPMDMVQANEWTLENFVALVQDLYVDNNQDGKKDKNDFFGASLYSTDLDSFMIGAGITTLEKNADGELQISEKWNSQHCADICEAVGSALSQPGIFGSTSRTPFQNQQSVFHMDRGFNIPGTDLDSGFPLDFAIGVVPVPKFNESQDGYKTNLGNPYTIYAVNSQSDTLEAAVTTLEAMASENYRSVTPAVFEVAMKVRYTDDPQVAEMFDILKENVSFDAGKLYHYAMGGTTTTLFVECCTGNSTNFLTMLQRSEKAIKAKLKTIMEAYN